MTTPLDRVRKKAISAGYPPEAVMRITRMMLDELVKPDDEMLRAGVTELRLAIPQPDSQGAAGFNTYVRSLAGVTFAAMLSRAER